MLGRRSEGTGVREEVRGVFQFYPESMNISTKVEDRIKYVLKEFFLQI